MSEEVLSRQRKEIKALEGEKRATLKKIKGTKGKKGKELVAATEAEYQQKLEDLQKRHKEELASEAQDPDPTETTAIEKEEGKEAVDPEQAARERKQAKARRKREKAKQAELDRQARIEEETKNAGPSARQMELEQMENQLHKQNLTIVEVPSDGNCLYRAVAAQCVSKDYGDIRNACADSLQTHQEDFVAFCEFNDKVPDYAAYVERVRNSSDWGGHLELRALSLALKRTIEVYSTSTTEPLVLSHDDDEGEPIRLSYHLHYYTLGEHYNQVAPLTTGGGGEEES